LNCGSSQFSTMLELHFADARSSSPPESKTELMPPL
jgi:hypothetical protein